MRKSLMLMSIAGVLLLFALPSHAQTSLFSMERASIGATANFCVLQGVDQPAALHEQEWKFGAVAAYNLVSAPEGKAPLLSLAYSLNRGLQNQWWEHRVGVVVTLWKGSDQ